MIATNSQPSFANSFSWQSLEQSVYMILTPSESLAFKFGSKNDEITKQANACILWSAITLYDRQTVDIGWT